MKNKKNKDIVLSERDERLKKRLFYMILYIAYPAYILHSCIVSPLYTITDSNVALKGILSLSLRFLYEAIDLFVIFFSLSVMVYGLCRLGGKNMRSVIALAMFAPIFKYVLKIIVSPIVDGFVDIDQFLMDVYTLGVSGGLEILQLTIIILLSYVGIKKYRARQETMRKAYEKMGHNKDLEYKEELIPFDKIFGFRNPLQKGAFISAIVVLIVRIAMQLISDLFRYYNIVFNMLFFLPYILSIVASVLGYLLMIYVFMNVGLRDE